MRILESHSARHAAVLVFGALLLVVLATGARASAVCDVVKKVVSGEPDLASVRTGKVEQSEWPEYVVPLTAQSVWSVNVSPPSSKAWAESTLMIDVPVWTSWKYVAILREAGPATADTPRDPVLKAAFEATAAELGMCLGGWERANRDEDRRSVAASEFRREGWRVVLEEAFQPITQPRKRRFVSLQIWAPRPVAKLLAESFDGEAPGWLRVDPATGSARRPGDAADTVLKNATVVKEELKGVTAAVRDGTYVLDLTGVKQGSFASTIPVRIAPDRGFTITATLTVHGQTGAGLTWGGSESARNLMLLTTKGNVTVGTAERAGWKGAGAWADGRWTAPAGYRKDRNVIVIKRVGGQVDVSLNGTALGAAGAQWFGSAVGFVVNAGSRLIVDDLTVTQP